MVHRKRPLSSPQFTKASRNGSVPSNGPQLMLHRPHRSGGSCHQWTVTTVLIGMSIISIAYLLISHHLLLKSSQVALRHRLLWSYEREFSQPLTSFPVIDKGPVPPKMLPQRPRAMGLYDDADSEISNAAPRLLVSEPLDPNMIRYYHVGATPDMTPEAWKRQQEIALGSKDYRHERAEVWETKECKAMYDWQTQSFPTCNFLMERDLARLGEGMRQVLRGEEPVRLMAHGYWRDVWKHQTQFERVVVKTIRYEHEYGGRNFERHRRDAMAMERLTSSEYVMNIYGFCGNSGLFEYEDGGSLDDSIFYRKEEDNWSPQERVVVAQQVAAGIADLHSYGQQGRPAIAHTDITTSQFVYVGQQGIYKLNDFNRCRFLRWNQEKNETCTYTVGNNPGTFRSPEEYAYKPQTEKVDIYSMGNVFYSMLTGTWPFYKDPRFAKSDDTRNHIVQGGRPLIDQQFLNSTDPFDKVLLKAIEMCWVQDPTQRSSARQVQRFLEERLESLGVERVAADELAAQNA